MPRTLCSQRRDYSRLRVDGHSFAVNARGESCYMWPTSKMSITDVCRNSTARDFIGQRAARLAVAAAGHAPHSKMSCGPYDAWYRQQAKVSGSSHEAMAKFEKLQISGCVPSKFIAEPPPPRRE